MTTNPTNISSKLATFVEVATDPSSLEHYGRDWRKEIKPHASAITFPTNVEEVQALVKFAISNRVALIPSGGRTGLSGGATATKGEIVVSFDRMNRLSPVDVMNRSVTTEAGVISAKLINHVEEANMYLPLKFSAQESSQVGGNIATSVGGERVLKYGPLKNWITSLTIVDGRGDVHHLNKGLIKNRSGYDLLNLFIGSEGTLGFITEATFRLLPQKEKSTHVLLAAVEDPTKISNIYKYLDQTFDIELLELIDQTSLRLVNKHHNLQAIFPNVPYCLLIEVETQDDYEEKLATLIEDDLVQDMLIAQDAKQRAELFARRARISETLSGHYHIKKYDVAVRIKDVARFVDELRKVCADKLGEINLGVFGHVGDGNLHVNFFSESSITGEALDEMLWEVVNSFDGTMSGEHGIGLMKKEFLKRQLEPATLNLMKLVKGAFDPHGIINPGKVFDCDSVAG